MLLTYRALKRASLAKKLGITAPNGIDESSNVRIGGIDQWISIRGEDLSNPVILEIHGGPGASNLIFIPRTRAWERHFTIVRWDMRGAGRTFAAGGPAGQGEMTLDRVYQDALEVTAYVRERLGVARLLLVANSFGTVTGLRLARNHPELYSAYVGTDQNVIDGGRDTSSYEALLARLEKAGKKKELAKIVAMGPDRTAWSAHEWADHAKIVTTTDPLTYDTMKTVVIRSLWFSPFHTLRGLRMYLKGMSFSEQLGPQAMTIDERAEGTSFRLPFFIFQGDSDVLTPPEPAHRLYEQVTAPVKGFALIRNASHFASFRHPDQFLDLMLSKVRPVVSG
ncbi:alpha/beta fold hydrolase [Streptomyces diastatochromogenes]|uniref:Proline iminopeptidase n=1 Tax=Streptomyces diastatochromogenes TaxID=42236 RepID=A0A233SJ57_STRDA|nr:alpha/beta hydrolase [Streptomyces diastatochromogenes]MCZ0988677.1 alpha/beta hydrolase [Streptomyces diastatochromogenes]OXY95683.1 proline iminopeptidase [Streptomyces diastatochromogenes]